MDVCSKNIKTFLYGRNNFVRGGWYNLPPPFGELGLSYIAHLENLIPHPPGGHSGSIAVSMRDKENVKRVGFLGAIL